MILVTGATGFVGRAVTARLVADRRTVRGAIRGSAELPPGVESVQVGDLSASTNWTPALVGVQTVVHAAARVHVMRDSADDPPAEFRKANVEGSLRLARQAAERGVRRFIFISSIKVNGEETQPGRSYTAEDSPGPVDAYGLSKLEAESGLRELARQTGMEVVIIRPVLVYGPGVKANFRAMTRAIHRGLPLPFGAVDKNRRSLVALDNLVDLIVTCIDHPAAANQTFLVSDDEDLSTSELLRRTAFAMGRRARLIPVPATLLTMTLGMLGKHAVAHRLTKSLQVNMAKTRSLLGWKPPVSVDEGLRRATADLHAK